MTEFLKVMDENQISRVIDMINEELRNLSKSHYEESLYYIVKLFPTEYWQRYDCVAIGFAKDCPDRKREELRIY